MRPVAAGDAASAGDRSSVNEDFRPALKQVEGVATCRLEVQGHVIHSRLALRCEQLDQGMLAAPQDATSLQWRIRVPDNDQHHVKGQT